MPPGKILAPVTLREAFPTLYGELSARYGPSPVDPHPRPPTLWNLVVARTSWQLRAQHLVSTRVTCTKFSVKHVVRTQTVQLSP